MTKSLPLALLSAATLLCGTAAIAAAAPQAKPAAKPTVARVASTKTTRTTTRTVAKGRMVTAKLANGKTVTYNCALPGNATKQACKS